MKAFFVIFTNIILFLPFAAYGQRVLFCESFDSVSPPQLPKAWETSSSGSTSDVSTTTSIPHSAPSSAILTNAKKYQWIMSPSLDCLPNSSIRLEFFDRRSTTFTSDIVVEISTDNGITFTSTGDTLRGNIFNLYVQHRIEFTIIEEIPAIRIRWKVVGNGAGTVATYRLDDIIIVSSQLVDIGIEWITNTPLFPKQDEIVMISGCVKNWGTSTAHDIRIALAYDADRDSFITADEIVEKKTITVLASLDSIVVEYNLVSLRSQRSRYALMVSSTEDANPSNDTLWLGFFVSPRANSIVINEIMPAPHSGESEWIELYLTGKDTIDLEEFCMDNRRKKISFKECHFGQEIPSPGYILLTRDTVFLKQYYGLTEGLFIRLPLPEHFLNNSEGDIVLSDANNRILDSLHYRSSWGSSPGVSLERINALDIPDSSNWTYSRHEKGGTPGKRNSVSRKKQDVDIKNFYNEYTRSPSGIESIFHATLVNRGIDNVNTLLVDLFEDNNCDSLLAQEEQIASLRESELAAGTERDVLIGPLKGKTGIQRYALTVSYSGSEGTIQVTSWCSVNTPYLKNSIVINEIMFEPHDGEAEYIEIWNTSDENIDLSNWKVTDGTRSHSVTIPPLKVVHPKGFFVVASDSSLYTSFAVSAEYCHIAGKSDLSLNNDTDAVCLFDPSGTLIDSVWYLKTWHHPDRSTTTGISLERIFPNRSGTDQQNWTSSTVAEGGTPGKQNSVFLKSEPEATTVSISPNPFSPDGDGVDDEVMFSAEFPSHTATIRVRIFDSAGRLVKTLAQGNPIGSQCSLRWDGMNDNSQHCRIGLYIVYIEAINGTGGVKNTVKRPLVLAHRL